MAVSTSTFRGGPNGAGTDDTWFHDCPMNGPTGTMTGEACCNCGAVERLSRVRLRAVLQCIEGGKGRS